MPLADFRMPSMTGSEAVYKYIYVSERPPDNILEILNIQIILLSDKPLHPVFPIRPLPCLSKKTRHLHDSMMTAAPMQATKHPKQSGNF